ncbi:MAG: hypothetical protein WD877_02200 [Candidatus Saccharimonadales bacterium]
MSLYQGTYGDHAKPGGYNSERLAEYYARKRAEREAKGDFGAAAEIDIASRYVALATSTRHLRKAEIIYANAGILAAKEARFHGYEIKGWDSEISSTEPPAFERMPDGDALWFIDSPLSHVEGLPRNLRFLGQLANNFWIDQMPPLEEDPPKHGTDRTAGPI